MSLGLGDKDIATQYQQIVSGGSTEWMVLSYDKGSNDLKVQATGDSGLEEMFEEFKESRSVYVYVLQKRDRPRTKDAQADCGRVGCNMGSSASRIRMYV